MGVSVYSRAVELIKEGDRRYSNICWEYEGTQLAVHVATSMLKYNRDLDKFEYQAARIGYTAMWSITPVHQTSLL